MLNALLSSALVSAVHLRAPPPQMTSLFTKRTFFISAPFVGNNNFDPMGLASGDNMPHFVALRHAEVKHGRLAMLAAIAWPMQETVHPMLVERLRGLRLGVPNLLDASGGCSPILQPEVLPALALTLCLGAALELNEVGKRTRAGLRFNEWAVDSVAGCYDWDPLGIAKPLGVTDRFELQEAEMLNGRLAMLAVASYVAQEQLTSVPVAHTIFASPF